MARALSNYRTTKKPKVNTPSLDTTNPLNNYSDNKVVDGGASNNQGITPLDMYTNRGLQKADTSALNMGNSTSLDITQANKQPVNSDLNYYTQLTNMKNKNDLLVEKYGLQGVRDQAVSDLAQQDVIRQQSDRALAEQLRATGLNSGAMSETMRGNLLMNYAGNVKDIQNNYNNTIAGTIDKNQLDNYNSVLNRIDSLIQSDNLTSYNSKEVLDMINSADINESQKNDLLKYYNTAMASINGEEVQPELPTGVKSVDGKYVFNDNFEIPNNLIDSGIIATDGNFSAVYDLANKTNNVDTFIKNVAATLGLNTTQLITYQNDLVELFNNLKGIGKNGVNKNLTISDVQEQPREILFKYNGNQYRMAKHSLTSSWDGWGTEVDKLPDDALLVKEGIMYSPKENRGYWNINGHWIKFALSQ